MDIPDAPAVPAMLDDAVDLGGELDVDLDELPDGAFVLHDGEAWLSLADELLHWTPAGYDRRVRRPAGRGWAITPPSLVEVLRTGWDGAVPLLHPTARKIGV